ncbi:hypothetical protein B0H17DRAFT_1053980 [Mycena rosella]|uniref:Uncharacterized protein n=1 Tax=Mycena rosella TaxID=1033263 RepID=A0AAD7GNK8_MYCRO|nr:hypothetical protein B0H17DRAFT_1053980 [Mycena rosella]
MYQARRTQMQVNKLQPRTLTSPAFRASISSGGLRGIGAAATNSAAKPRTTGRRDLNCMEKAAGAGARKW